MPTFPYVELSIVDIRARTRFSVGRWGVADITHPAAASERAFVRSSFVTLEILVSSYDGPIAITVNGQELKARKYGNSSVVELPLENDLDYYRLDVFLPPNLYVALDIFVQNHLEIGKNQLGGPFCAYKWTFGAYLAELERWRPLFRESQRSVVPSLLGEWANNETAYVPEWHRAAMDSILEVTKMLSLSAPSDFREDFAVLEEGDIDLEGLLEFAQEDRRFLSENINGPIRYKARRYSPALVPIEHNVASGLDFSPVLAVVRLVRGQLHRRPGTSGAIILAMEHLISVVSGMPTRRCEDYSIATAFLAAKMQGAQSARLQRALRRLVHITCLNGARDALTKAAEGLSQGIRDFNVFETSVFAACALALGFSEAEILSSDGLLKSDQHVLANVNKTSGRKYFTNGALGWRANSIQPSDYAPDLFILYEMKVPIFVDAKFRIGQSIDLIANASGLKEFQAYMDEFGLDHGIVIVPKSLHSQLLSVAGPQKKYISGTGRHGVLKKIIVVELPDTASAESIANVREAISDIGRCFGH